MDTDLIDAAACAASDLGARLNAELASAQAQLATAEARALAALSADEPIPTAIRNQRILHRQQIAVLRRILADVPAFAGDHHAA